MIASYEVGKRCLSDGALAGAARDLEGEVRLTRLAANIAAAARESDAQGSAALPGALSSDKNQEQRASL